MRTIKWEEWKQRRRSRIGLAAKIDNTFQGRAAGRRPRDPEKERILIQFDLERRRRYIESGKLVKLGPRHYRWRLDLD